MQAVLEGRFEVDTSEDGELGRGGFCVVRRGREVASGKSVAIKSYSAQYEREAGAETVCEKFAHEVAIFKALGLLPGTPPADVRSQVFQIAAAMAPTAENGSKASFVVNHHLREMVLKRSTADCFVKVCGHGKQMAEGEIETEERLVVLELADYTLEEFLEATRRNGTAVSLAEVWDILRSMVESLAWIHALGMVHLDVKPANFMSFSGKWKMIDMDGAQQTCCDVEMAAFYTPMYASPELAQAVVSGGSVKLSRTMDMWSFGITILDILCAGTALQELQSQFQTQALFGEEDEFAFLRCIADESRELRWATDLGLPPSEALENKQLQHLLDSVIVKTPSNRLSASEALAHPYLLVDAKPVVKTSGAVLEPPLRAADLGSLGIRRKSHIGAAATRHRKMQATPEPEMIGFSSLFGSYLDDVMEEDESVYSLAMSMSRRGSTNSAPHSRRQSLLLSSGNSAAPSRRPSERPSANSQDPDEDQEKPMETQGDSIVGTDEAPSESAGPTKATVETATMEHIDTGASGSLMAARSGGYPLTPSMVVQVGSGAPRSFGNDISYPSTMPNRVRGAPDPVSAKPRLLSVLGEQMQEELEEENQKDDRPPANVLDVRAPLVSGWLDKRGPMFGYRWAKHWCVLESTGITYFSDEACQKKKGDIILGSSTTAIPFRDATVGDCGKHCQERPFGFLIDIDPSKGRSRKFFYFDAGSDSALKEWVDGIALAARKLLALELFPSEVGFGKFAKTA